ncbi:hypothetical protein F0U44_02730 [Nocardioides humilatus]|uniref:Uncharacterized protein n=1 Tax=Nocardioides humilatus TaxID=2607660 RepID=A0A5B1LL96_9ACTN|nr:hypothetical protein [Nocardioides humilatus]KAA1421244.1 hypothetical protein F0U44_02730 [Nocardioides humilatus]
MTQPPPPPPPPYTGAFSATAPSRQPPNAGITAAVFSGGIIFTFLGMILAFQSVTLLTGTGTNWVGVVIAIASGTAATITMFLMNTHLWAKIVLPVICAGLIGLSVLNVIYVEVQLSEKRDEFSDTFGN